MGCCTSTCSANYHFQCARRSNCLFLYNKQVFCSSHREHGEGEVALPEGEVAVTRGIFVDTHPDRPGRKIPRTLEVSKAAIQIGTFIFFGAYCIAVMQIGVGTVYRGHCV